ncbi:two-component response regulator [Citrobacter koseri]|uniref:Two-component response regulator n=1 Tax=Citrobacter koseri TaxID=545 RepID=A0A447UR41_CITKO|nr:two-component response regulator [Citrobacter koseri]
MHQILSEYDINLVIMDINLPGKNGLLLARELREQANVALMFLTGRDNEVDKSSPRNRRRRLHHQAV